MKTNKLFVAVIFLFGASLFAQNTDYSKEPGYFDFEKAFSIKIVNSITEIYLEEPMLKILAKMAESKEEGLAAVIEALKLIKVNEIMIGKKDSAKIEDNFDSMDKQLQSLKWDRIIRTKRVGNLANVYVKKGTGDEYLGLVIVALDKTGKATFVNIVGKIDLATIGQLSEKFNIPKIGEKKK